MYLRGLWRDAESFAESAQDPFTISGIVEVLFRSTAQQRSDGLKRGGIQVGHLGDVFVVDLFFVLNSFVELNRG